MFTHAIPFLLLSYTFLFLSFITCDCYLVCSTVAAIRALPKLISLLYSGGHMYFHRFGKPETDGCIIIQHDCIMLHIYSISVSRLFCLLVLSSLFQVLLLLIIISDNVINSSSTDYAINLSIHCVVHLFSHHWSSFFCSFLNWWGREKNNLENATHSNHFEECNW